MTLDPAGPSGSNDGVVGLMAKEAFAVLNTGRQIAPFSTRFPGFEKAEAYRVTAAVRKAREDRGERPIGRKIGFTNRTIWAEYDVHAPMWGYVYDTTVHDLVALAEPFDLTGLAEPRIEPEIVFGLARPPEPGMSAADLIACIGWVAHGFEIVQSIFPGWRFSPADTVAAYGLHGALFIGPRHAIETDRAAWLRDLAQFEIDLSRNGTPMDHGRAVNVLDGPLFALRHLVDVLASDQANPPLAAGEIVTTGTLTRAFPVSSGELWQTHLTGIDIGGVELAFR